MNLVLNINSVTNIFRKNLWSERYEQNCEGGFVRYRHEQVDITVRKSNS